jgi:LmbE family N-acetylglucosaminyl deacetylase
MAVGAHPDDIEFMMAGTLLLLKEAGADIHMWNLANGCIGSAALDRGETVRVRREEAGASAQEAGATLHPPIVDDLSILYEPDLIAATAAMMRTVRPGILLLPAPDDYMEDHVNASRLLVTAAFARRMPNFRTEPAAEAWEGDTVLYHAMPYGLRGILRRLVMPGQYVDVAPVLEKKRVMLAKHVSQGDWLDASQGVGSRVEAMEDMCLRVGMMSGRFEYAEGWRRHLHLGFSSHDTDPLSDVLGDACLTDPDYERSLGDYQPR